MVLSELSYCLHNASKAVLQTQIERFITEWNQVAHPFNWSTQSVALAAPWVPAGEVIRVSFDETTKKKAGLHIAGLARYRNGAGAARQAYRPWRGVHCGLGRRPISPAHGGPATAAASPWDAHALAKHRQPSASTGRINPAVRWPALALPAWRSRAPAGPAGAWLPGAIAPRTLAGSCPRQPRSWDVSRSTPRSRSGRPPPPPSVAVSPATKARCSARPPPGRRPRQGGDPTRAKRAPSSKPGVACGTRWCRGASCRSWGGDGRANPPPHSRAKEPPPSPRTLFPHRSDVAR